MSVRRLPRAFIERRATVRAWPHALASYFTSALAGVALCCALVMSACAPAAAKMTRSPATPTSTTPAKWIGISTPTASSSLDSTPHPLPAFSDWRLVYPGPDGLAHVVSLDGKTRLVGPALPTDYPPDSGFYTAGSAPDGRFIAYAAAYFHVVDLKAGVTRSYAAPDGPSGRILWSPDQRYFAESNDFTLDVFDIAQDHATLVPKSNARLIGPMYGWLDSQHAAVGYIPDMTSSAEPLESLNVVTGVVRPIFIMRSPMLGAGGFSLLPGGRQALFYNEQIHSDPYTPEVGVVNTTTGVFTRLPYLTSICPAFGGFTQILWRPNSQQAIVTTGFPENQDLRYLLIDVAHDSATPLALSGFPEAWTPDGSSVILANEKPFDSLNGVGWGDVGDVGSGPFTLTRVTFDANWKITGSITLATDAMNIPVLGFTHTA